MAQANPQVEVHIHNEVSASLERKVNRLMAQIEDLTAKIEALSTAVTAHITRDNATKEALASLTVAYNELVADDAVENAKLGDLSAAVDDLTAAVNEPVEVPVDPAPDVEPVIEPDVTPTDVDVETPAPVDEEPTA